MSRAPVGSLLGVTVLAALLCWPARSFAAAVTVNTTNDSSPVPSQCLGVAGDCGIRQAITKANPSDTVIVPSGTYLLSQGGLTVTKNLTINGAGARTTTVSGNGLSLAFDVGAVGVSVTLSGMTISGGHRVAANFPHGGAIDTDADSLTLDRVSVSGTTQESVGTTLTARGGGISVAGGAANLTVKDSAIVNNRQLVTGTTDGNQGGAIFASGANSVKITNSTIAGNSQATPGGGSSAGAAVYNIGTDFVIESSTIAGNTGSAALNNGTEPFSLKNTIIANGALNNCSGTFTSLGHNLEDGNGCGLAAAGDQPNKDPLLAPLADNGGPTDTRALAANSPAVNAADSAACPATDQRDIARPAGACDIGAFEYVPPVPDTTAPSLSALGIGPGAFTAAGGKGPSIARKKKKAKPGGTVSYSLSEAATVQFTVERLTKGRKRHGKCVAKSKKGKRCKFFKAVKGSFARSSTAGPNSFKFTGRINNKRLRAASYRLVAVATDAAGNKGAAQNKAFRIKK